MALILLFLECIRLLNPSNTNSIFLDTYSIFNWSICTGFYSILNGCCKDCCSICFEIEMHKVCIDPDVWVVFRSLIPVSNRNIIILVCQFFFVLACLISKLIAWSIITIIGCDKDESVPFRKFFDKLI